MTNTSPLSTLFNSKQNVNIAIIGLGYVGLPLAIEFAKKYNVLGFDINTNRVEELSAGKDSTREANVDDLNEVILSRKGNPTGLSFSSNTLDLKDYNIFIVTVPTPINQFKSPDLGPLLKASAMLGQVLKQNDVVIYESTVYPGCTEEDCVPVLERVSGLQYNTDFFCWVFPRAY